MIVDLWWWLILLLLLCNCAPLILKALDWFGDQVNQSEPVNQLFCGPDSRVSNFAALILSARAYRNPLREG